MMARRDVPKTGAGRSTVAASSGRRPSTVRRQSAPGEDRSAHGPSLAPVTRAAEPGKDRLRSTGSWAGEVREPRSRWRARPERWAKRDAQAGDRGLQDGLSVVGLEPALRPHRDQALTGPKLPHRAVALVRPHQELVPRQIAWRLRAAVPCKVARLATTARRIGAMRRAIRLESFNRPSRTAASKPSAMRSTARSA